MHFFIRPFETLPSFFFGCQVFLLISLTVKCNRKRKNVHISQPLKSTVHQLQSQLIILHNRNGAMNMKREPLQMYFPSSSTSHLLFTFQ